MPPDPALEAEIRRLAQEIEPGLLGKRAVEIAADLISFSPTLALELVERASQDSGSHGDMDWALARLSLAWTFANEQHSDTERVDDSLRARIADPAARRFTARVAAVVSGSSAERVLSEADRFTEAEEKLYFLRNWLAYNTRRADAAKVADVVLALAVDTTADFLRDIALPLAHSDDTSCVRRCISIIDNLKGTLADRSRRLHLLELELALGTAEATIGIEGATERFLAVSNEALENGDLIDRCESLALLLASLSALGDAAIEIEKSYGIADLTRGQLRVDVNRLLEATADHYKATKNIVRYLAHNERVFAEQICAELNTLERREALLRDLALHELDRPAEEIDWAWLIRTGGRITGGYLADVVIADACETLRRNTSAPLTAALYADLWRLAERISDAATRFNSLCGLFAYGIQSGNAIKVMAATRADAVTNALQSVDSKPEQIDVGYAAVSHFASVDPTFARELLGAIERTQGSSPLTGMVPSLAYRDIVRLAIKAFGGIVAQGLEFEAAERGLETLIQRVPSASAQVILWSHVAMQYIRHRKSDSARDVVRRFVRPLIDAIPSADRESRRLAMHEALPPLFLANKTLVIELIDESLVQERNEYVHVLCNFLLRGVTANEPYEVVHGRAPEADEDAILDVCNLLLHSESDATVWHYITTIADAIVSGRTRTPLSAQKRADIVRRLREVATAKIPHPDGIQHDGPSIVVEAQLARIDDAKPEIWIDLVERARKVSNLADRCLILYTIADILPKKEKIGRVKLIAEARQAADAMPASLDQIERLVDLAETVAQRDEESAKRALQHACTVARGLDSAKSVPRAGRILDVAYRIDESLAQTLAKELDGDEARKAVRKRGEERVRLLEMKKRIGTGHYRDKKARHRVTDLEYVRAAGMALGALNAGLKRPSGLAALREGGAIAASLPLDQAGPLYVWIVENVARSTDRSQDTRSAVTALFQSAVTAADLTYQLVDRASGDRRAAVQTLERDPVGGFVAGAEERERVFEFIRNWGIANTAKVITICDPYFGPDDLDVVELLSWAVPEASFRVLAAQWYQEQQGVEYPYKEAYRRTWRTLTDRDPPFVDVIVVGDSRTKKSPIHDRWILTEDAGLTLGTSTNSLGRTKLSQVRELLPESLPDVWRRLEPVISRSARIYEGHRVEFDSFSL
jgi:hypothetical protein